MDFLICPDCNEGNSVSRVFCAKCGASLRDVQVQQAISRSLSPFGIKSGAISLGSTAATQEKNDFERIEGAGIGIRSLAWGIDSITHYIVGSVAILCAAFIAGMVLLMSGMSFDEIDALSQKLSEKTIPDFILIVLGFILYRTFCEGLHGSSLGKLICGLVVVKENGQSCGLLAAFLRSLALLIDGLFFCIPAIISMSDTRKQQRLGDRWARTMVVKRRDVKEIVPLQSGLWFVPAFLGGVMLDGALTGLAVLLKFVIR